VEAAAPAAKPAIEAAKPAIEAAKPAVKSAIAKLVATMAKPVALPPAPVEPPKPAIPAETAALDEIAIDVDLPEIPVRFELADHARGAGARPVSFELAYDPPPAPVMIEVPAPVAP